MPINRIEMHAEARTVDHFTHPDGRADFDLDPPYQRGEVWGAKRKRNLIRSLISGVPIPAVVVGDRHTAAQRAGTSLGDAAPAYAIVDGKQRITAMRDFVDSKLPVPGDWFGMPTEYVVFSDLPRADQLGFRRLPVPVSVGALPDLEAERAVFDLVNFGGLAQGEVDDDR